MEGRGGLGIEAARHIVGSGTVLSRSRVAPRLIGEAVRGHGGVVF